VNQQLTPIAEIGRSLARLAFTRKLREFNPARRAKPEKR